MSYAGYEKPTSPAIDGLAAESLDFREAFSHAPSTLPSHATLFTSRYPFEHMARPANHIPLADGFTTIAEHFQNAGFQTAAFVNGGQMAAVWNVSQGFDLYDDVTPMKEPSRFNAMHLEEILCRATNWLEQHRSEPFFCFVHCYVVHSPYTPPEPYKRMFGAGYQGSLPDEIDEETLYQLNKSSNWSRENPDVQHVASRYDAEIRYMDEQVGKFLLDVDRLGLRNNTVLVFLSDHGEEFGEHGHVGMHGHTLMDELLHVPLIMRVPGVRPRVVQRQVRLVDVSPTLLALMNVSPGEVGLRGENLLRDGDPWGPDLPVFCQKAGTTVPIASLRYPGRKLIGYGPGTYRLFDLTDDPAERADLFDWNRPEHVEMVKELQAFMADASEGPIPAAAPVQLPEEVREQLKALGYVK